MPRPIWSGSISFGLVNVPVKLFSAVSRKTVSFNQIDSRTGSRIRYKKVSAADETEVPAEAIVKGYELPSGQYVLVDDGELSSLDPEATRTIDIEEFVDLAEIDPIYFDKTYYVAPQEGGEKAYHLLVRTLRDQERVGVAKFAMRQKEHLCALRVKDDMFVLETMHWPAEIREPDIEGLDAKVQVREREVEMAMSLVDQLTGPFEPGRYRNTFEQELRKAAEAKLKGKEVTVTPEAEEAAPVSDLMEMLRASLDAAKSGTKPSRAKATSSSKSKSKSKSTKDDDDGDRPRSRAWLLDRSRNELYELAKDEQVEGRSDMTKDALVDALQQ